MSFSIFYNWQGGGGGGGGGVGDGHIICQYILSHISYISPSVSAGPPCHGASCTHSGQASCFHDNVLYIFHAMYPVLVLKAQGRSQTSEQDEASIQRRRCEPLEGSGGIHNALLSIYRSGIFFFRKVSLERV